MCTIYNKCNKRIVTGYKVAIQKGNHYYSPFTGMEYKKGKIKPMTKYGKNIDPDYRNVSVLTPGSEYYNENMTGKTGVILDKKLARIFRDDVICNCNAVVLKMTIKGDLYKADFASWPTIVGNEIVSIKKIS